MSRADLLHLDLDITVLRIYIVKELLPRLAAVGLDLSIEAFVYMHDILHPEPEVIQGSEFIIGLHRPDGSLEGTASEHQHAAEIEIVPQRPFLAGNQRMFLSHGRPIRPRNHLIMIGIQHISPRILCHSQNTVESKKSHLQRKILGIYKNEFL